MIYSYHCHDKDHHDQDQVDCGDDGEDEISDEEHEVEKPT